MTRAISIAAALAVLGGLALLPASSIAASPDASVAKAKRCKHGGAAPNKISRRAFRRALLCEVNRVRRKRGLRRLKASRSLQRAAAEHARNMVRQQFFGHVSPTGSTIESRNRKYGWARRGRPWAIGELLATGKGTRGGSARSAVRFWMSIPGQRINILTRRFFGAGFGVAKGSVGDPFHPSSPNGITVVGNLGWHKR